MGKYSFCLFRSKKIENIYSILRLSILCAWQRSIAIH